MDYVLHQPMKCGSAEAEAPMYHKVVDNRGNIWLYADGKFSADRVYVSGGPGSRGFGGRTLKFQLVDGSTQELTGPWHTDAGSLFKATGVDIRNKHSSRVVISKGLERDDYHSVVKFTDVLYLEEEFVEGSFDREEAHEKAQQMATDLGQELYYFKETGGGSVGFWVSPKGEKCSTG